MELPNTASSRWDALPAGWSTAVSPHDGRMYYWEESTGKTSWTHPLASAATAGAMHNQTRSASAQTPPPPPPDHQQTSVQTQNVNPWFSFGTRAKSTRFNNGSRNNNNSSAIAIPYGYSANTMNQPLAAAFTETPYSATRRPESHQCYAVVSLILFPPLGLCACMHSYQVDSCWKDGQYGDAINHSRQAKSYANFSILVGIILWIYLIFFAEPGGRRIQDLWPDDWGFNN